MMNKQPSYAKEKSWLDRITKHGCVITGKNEGIVRHHPAGREAKKNKYWIGRWFALPLDAELHEYHSPHPLNVHNHKKAFVAAYGKQSQLFADMCEAIRIEDGFLPFDDEVLEAILATNV